MNLAYILVDAGLFQEGFDVALDLRDREPEYIGLRRNYFLHELRAGRIEDGAESFVIYTRLTGGDVDAAREIGAMMIAYAHSGQVGNISKVLIDRAQLGTEDLGQIFAFVGDVDKSLAALRVAIDQRSGSRSVLGMKINPAYDLFRSDPRFIAMLQEIGLAD